MLKVPVGTEIYEEDGETLIADLAQPGERVLLAEGGNGGFGNAHFKSSTNQAPRSANPGLPGEEKTIILQLKLIADAGLVGLPNAGKSTFLSRVTAAKPKIADYPFTTLDPQLGVVKVDDTEFVLADLPGLIEGAHEGVGLGDRFLGHAERCSVILHLIDGTESEIVKAYKTIRDELEAYGHGLADKTEILALNKIDAIEQIRAEPQEGRAGKGQRQSRCISISGVSGEGVQRGVARARARDRRPPQDRAESRTSPKRAWTP